MARIVITGAGIVGLGTAMMLANDGHEVVMLERDPSPPPDTAVDAWADWERRGVNQFRLLHFFLPRWRGIVERELPDVIPAMLAAGALKSNPLAEAPAEVTGGWRDGDEEHTVITGRRPVVETVVARLAEATPGITIRRGVAVAGLTTGPSAMPGVPHVTGVRTETGEETAADLVVDMSGRRSPLPAWLDAIGARPPIEEVEDSGFVYYGRHFRSGDGSVPPSFGALLQSYGSISTLTLPADNGTWGCGIITSGKDAALRKCKDVEAWERVWRSYPLVAHWADGTPLADGVDVMAKLEDRIRTFVVDGTPVATGVVAVADAWACTNPSLGRGMSIGMTHAVAFRDLLRSGALDDPGKFALAFQDATDAAALPWYQATNHFDRHRLAETEACMNGESYDPGDPVWEMVKAMDVAATRDPDVLRALLCMVGITRPADAVLAIPGVVDKIIELGGDWRSAEPPGPNREQLLAVLEG